MKKIAALFAAVMMALGTTISAVSAAEFTPSVQGKDAPDIVSTTNKEGKEIVAVVKAPDDSVVGEVLKAELVVTPVSKRQDAPKEISDNLVSAYNQINAAKDLTEIVPDIENTVEKISGGLTADQMVVRDLFDVSVNDVVKNHMEKGNLVEVRFSLGLAADDFVACLHNVSGNEWEVIDPSRVKNNGDGSVTVSFTSLSPIAFVVEAKAETEPEISVPSESDETPDASEVEKVPQTGHKGNPVLWAGISVIVLAVGGAAVLLRVKKK